MSDLSATIDARLQCTHQFDIAALAVTAAARETAYRRYDAVVEDQAEGVRRALLWRDDVLVLKWTMQGKTILSPPYLFEIGIGSGFTSLAASMPDPEEEEAALVLRRAVFVSGGRGRTEEIDAIPYALPRSGCWVQQPERAPSAKRIRGSTQDFTGRREALTRDDDAWLAFADLRGAG